MSDVAGAVEALLLLAVEPMSVTELAQAIEVPESVVACRTRVCAPASEVVQATYERSALDTSVSPVPEPPWSSNSSFR